jgi:ribosomal protein L22
MGGSLLREHLARVVDPDPRSRVRWQRKMIMKRVARNLDIHGRETKAERLVRTERQYVSASVPLPTSTKKLGHLARQVAGKTVEDALVQMRFSMKKMAREVRWQLEEARDEAVVQRGMGLGRASGTLLPEGKEAKIQTKAGSWMTIQDPTRLYVAQAWVGRKQPRGRTVVRRARGRRNILIHPQTCKYTPDLF